MSKMSSLPGSASIGSKQWVAANKKTRNIEHHEEVKMRSIPDSNWGYQKTFDNNQNLE
jgi:hypothetical protein